MRLSHVRIHGVSRDQQYQGRLSGGVPCGKKSWEKIHLHINIQHQIRLSIAIGKKERARNAIVMGVRLLLFLLFFFSVQFSLSYQEGKLKKLKPKYKQKSNHPFFEFLTGILCSKHIHVELPGVPACCLSISTQYSIAEPPLLTYLSIYLTIPHSSSLPPVTFSVNCFRMLDLACSSSSLEGARPPFRRMLSRRADSLAT